MRVQWVAALAAAGMGLTSFGVWQLTPPSRASATVRPDETPSIATAAAEDRSRFVSGQTLTLEGRVGHARLPGDRDQSTFVLATITGAAGAGSASTPLDLSIVVDVSGSMRGARLVNAVEAARGMVRRLRDGDRVTLITYSSSAQLLVPPTVIDPVTREQVVAAASRISAMGDTCISCGLEMAMQVARPTGDRVSRILVLSDGEATAGVRDLAGFQALAQRCQAMGTTVSTVGVDIEYNERVMGALAQFSNGRHYFVENPAGLPPVFDRELESLSNTVANDVELAVELAPGIQLEQVFDRAVRREGTRLIVPIGTVGPGEEKTFLVGVRVPAGMDEERAIASMRLRYSDLVRRAPGECEGTLAVRTAAEASELDPFVAARVSRSETIASLREANELAGVGRFAEARERLDRAQAQLRSSSGFAMGAAPVAARPRLDHDFDSQSQAIESARSGFGDPGLAAPEESGEGRTARRRAAVQERMNEDLVSPMAL
jgi:Ca-activated chloride channel family protein